MAQLVQGRGLQWQGCLPRTQQHINAGFGPPLLLPPCRHQGQHGAAMAGALAAIGQPLQWRPAAPEAHLGLFGACDPADAQQPRPLLQGGFDGGQPVRLAPRLARAVHGSGRFDPDAPVLNDRPAGRGGSQQMAVVAAIRGRQGRRCCSGARQRQRSDLGGAGAGATRVCLSLRQALGLCPGGAADAQGCRQQGCDQPLGAAMGHAKIGQWLRPRAGPRRGPSALPTTEWRQSRPARC